ncbi:MAG: sulfatase-like hydrolase/transferase [Myxococcota bacterium]
MREVPVFGRARIARRLASVSLLAIAQAACAPADPPHEEGGDAALGALVVSIDALGARHVGAYDAAHATTPRFDRLAARGALFERVYAQQTWTLTSHVSMLSGLYVATHGASSHTPARAGTPMLASILREEGFATAAFVSAGGYMKPDFGLGRGFDAYVVNDDGAATLDAARAWLALQAAARARDPEHRFLAFVHFYDVHSDVGTEWPYRAPDDFVARVFPDGVDWDRRGDTQLLVEMRRRGDATPRDLEVLHGLYDAEVLHADERRLGALLDALRELALDASTLVVATSDHGEELFEHGRGSHQSAYDEVARVPLAIAGPGVPRGARAAAWSELVDVAPTVLDALGLDVPASMQGESLLPLLDGRAAQSAVAHVDGRMPGLYGDYSSAIARDVEGVPWTLVGFVDLDLTRTTEDERAFALRGPGELYRLDDDPLQRHDLAAAEPALARRLARELLAWYDANERAAAAFAAPPDGGADAVAPGRALLSDAERERLRAIGYAE